jgi:subtilisin family serine protease
MSNSLRETRKPMRHLAALSLSLFAFCAASAYGARIDPRVTQQASVSGASDALLVLDDQASPTLAPLDTNADYRIRRRALVAALRARADASQRALRAWLDAHGIAHRDFWIANVMQARLPQGLLTELANRGELRRIDANPAVLMPLPQPQPQGARPDAPAATQGVTWGVAKIQAPAVWALGFTGQGVTIAGEDTGYQWDHPALKPHYRGWNGTSADHNHNWHDAIHNAAGNSCGNDVPAPCDDLGHGTHTAGTFAGDDGGANQTGVAPGAKWIGCRNMDHGTGTPARYIECMQWMLAPTDLAGNNPNPDLAPDVISNSWSCPQADPPAGEGCTPADILGSAQANLVNAGILFVVAAQNSGPSCSTILDPPGTYEDSFVIGATDSSDALANFSSRGPVSGSVLTRPDVSAPGVSIYSSVPTNTYATYQGTSMATPHVAGAAALLMSAWPKLKGRPHAIEDILRATATHAVTDPVLQSCGGTPITTWPNNMAGYGRIDVLAAYHEVIFMDGFDG